MQISQLSRYIFSTGSEFGVLAGLLSPPVVDAIKEDTASRMVGPKELLPVNSRRGALDAQELRELRYDVCEKLPVG